ncbi:MAG: GNAT family N-acetyltransferase [Firmicutes bacterium]|nr:GNAT family N-acetyltransferase [Bacillota bacterium]
MNLTGNQVTLRQIKKDDFCYIVAWSKDPEVNRYYDAKQTENMLDISHWYKNLKGNRYQKKFMILVNEQPIGDLEFDHIAWRSGEAELKIRIGEKDLWDKGYGTDAILVSLRYAFSKLNLNRIYLRVYADNGRAIRCYQKAGFVKEGRLGRKGSSREIILMSIQRFVDVS